MPRTRKDWPTQGPPTLAPGTPDPARSTAAADALIADLESEGTAEAGEFSLAPEAARKKMQQYQLAEPAHYVLLLVQAAVLRGARRLSFEFDTNDLRLVFDGQGLTRLELEGVHSALFAKRPGPSHASLQELALALTTAEALKPAHVQVRSTADGTTHELELRPGEAQVVRPAEPLDWPTRVQVRMPLGRAPHDVIREVLLARCRYSAAEIYLDRSRISRGMKLQGKLPQIPIAGPALRGVAGWAAEGAPVAGELRLVKNGAWFTTLRPPFLLPGAVVVIEGDQLRKTLSQHDVVQDEALPPVLDAARAAQPEALRALVESWARERDGEDARARHQTRRLLRGLCGYVVPPGRPLDPQRLDPVATTLLRAPLWRRFEGLGGGPSRHLSLLDLWEHARRGGVVGAVDVPQLRQEYLYGPTAPVGMTRDGHGRVVGYDWGTERDRGDADWLRVGSGALELLVAAHHSATQGQPSPELFRDTSGAPSPWALIAAPPGQRSGPTLILQALLPHELQYLRARLTHSG